MTLPCCKHLCALLGVSLALSASAQTPESAKGEAEIYRTFYLHFVTERSDAMDVITDMRNLLPRARTYYVPAEGAVSIKGSPADVAAAEQMLKDLDRPRKLYRLTYTITETDGGKRVSSQDFSLVVTPDAKTQLKQGSRVPVLTAVDPSDKSGVANVQYVDVGWNISASLDGTADPVRLRTKVELSTLAEDKASAVSADPVIRQGVVEGTAMLTQGKPLLLGSFAVLGTTRRQEIQVVSEPVP